MTKRKRNRNGAREAKQGKINLGNDGGRLSKNGKPFFFFCISESAKVTSKRKETKKEKS